MSIEVIRFDQKEEWDAIVRSFENYDVYYLSGYVKAFELHGDGIPYLFYYDGKGIRGINVVMKRDISKDSKFTDKIEPKTWFDFITPYGYGGWLIEGCGDINLLFNEYESWCVKHNIVSEFVRFHPVLNNFKHSESRYDVVGLGGTIAMDLSSPEVIWSNLTSKNKNMIRKAQKSGIKVYNGNYPEIYKTFKKIYNATMDKDNADDYYYFSDEFYNSILNDTFENAQIFYAELNDEIIAASIMLAANGRLNYHLSGSIREYQSLAPSNLLLYTAALWGNVNGCKTLHLGGGVGSQEDGLYKFKKSFYRGEPCRFHIGKKVFNLQKYNELINLRKDLNEESKFFPQYRA